MAMMIIRSDRTVTAVGEDGRIVRVIDCRNVQSAVALETKLSSDGSFAATWAKEFEATSPASKPHALERPMRDS